MHRNVLSARESSEREATAEHRGTGAAAGVPAPAAAPGFEPADRPALPECLFAHGFSFNKRRHLRRFAAGAQVRRAGHAAGLPQRATLCLWGSAPAPAGLRSDIEVIRVEDGFLRSVGLGADLARPLSWVMDRRGMYYDATRESDLERLLQRTAFAPGLLARAAALRERIAECGITKYSVGEGSWRRPQHSRVILVPGQVESDASVRFATFTVRGNMELLGAVRRANPNAYIVYKPHPDVAAGLRARGHGEECARDFCDEVVTDVPVAVLLDRVDEVHVLTSLAGFEALLRGRRVVCYGLPFYSGWGLTRDVLPLARRTRRLELDELVAATLIMYPLYVSRSGDRHISPEQALDELLVWRGSSAPPSRPWQYLRRAALRFAVGCP
jgi:capsular polysaccharide export protein